MQVVGFTDSDTHTDVLRRGAKGLGLNCDMDLLCLLCSGGMVLDVPLGDKPWTLGEYTRQHGGSQNRSKRVWGIVIPHGVGDHETMGTSDSVSIAIGYKITYSIWLVCVIRGVSVIKNVFLAAYHSHQLQVRVCIRFL